MREVIAVLNEALAEGPKRSSEIRELLNSHGISKRTEDRARKRLKIKATREGYAAEGYTLLSLPEQPEFFCSQDADEEPAKESGE